MTSLQVTILGCGTSRGVPAIPEDWGMCDPSEPKNRRQRASIHLQSETTSIIVDTTPDFRNQMIANNIRRIDATLLTHDHADHTHGIDDLRGYAYAQKKEIAVYMNSATHDVIVPRFLYAFEGKGGYPAICRAKTIKAYNEFTIGDMTILPFNQIHGRIHSLGFRVGDFAYSTDFNDLDPKALQALQGVKIWVVDALRYEPHPTHCHLEKTLELIQSLGVEQAYLTHMTGDMDYQSLLKSLPLGVTPAYDGLRFTL